MSCVCYVCKCVLTSSSTGEKKNNDDITPLEEYVLWMYFIYVCTTLPAFKAPTIPQQPPLQQKWQKNHRKSHLISLAQLVIIRSSWMYAMLASRASYDNLKGSSILDSFCRAVGKNCWGLRIFLEIKSSSESFECLVGCYVNQFEGETLERILWRKARWRRKTTRHSLHILQAIKILHRLNPILPAKRRTHD